MQKKVDDKILAFANKKAIAEKADGMLSKLIQAKSPVIVSWFKRRDLSEKSEVEIAKEWRQYYARNFILTKYPQGDTKVDAEIAALGNQVIESFSKKPFVERMEKLFIQTQKTALETVQAFPIPDTGKNEILARVKKIKLYWPRDFKTARNNSLPLDIIDWGIAYDPVANEVNMGMNAMSYPNKETYLAVFAHEIGHSFDSCRWGAFFSGSWPFEKVGACLRGETSVSAKKRDDSRLELMIKEGALQTDLAASLRQHPTCNKLVYPPPGIQADQLPEAFADWFSAEVIARIDLGQVENIRSDLCAERTLSDGSSYPSHQLRLQSIYFANPVLKAKRKQGLTSTANYCDLASPTEK